MTTITTPRRLAKMGFDVSEDGGGGYEIWRGRERVGRVFSRAGLEAWQPDDGALATPEESALSVELQDCARRYVAARARSGAALLESAQCLAEARSCAAHGDWYTFLDATNTSHDTADRLLKVADQAAADAAYAAAISDGRLAFTAAFELASAPVETRERLLDGDAPISAKAVQAEKRAAKSRTNAGTDLLVPSEEQIDPGAVWQSAKINGGNHPYTLEYIGDVSIAAEGQIVVYAFVDPRTETLFYIGNTQRIDARMHSYAIGSSSSDVNRRMIEICQSGYTVHVRALHFPATKVEADQIEYALIREHCDTLLNTQKHKWDVRPPAPNEAAPPVMANDRTQVFTQSGITLPIDLQKRLVAAGAAIGSDGTVYAPRASGEASAVLSEAEAEAAIARWIASPVDTAPAPAASDRMAHLAQEADDQRWLDMAEVEIGGGGVAYARQLLSRVSDRSAWRRDQLLAKLPTTETRMILLPPFPASELSALMESISAVLEMSARWPQANREKAAPALGLLRAVGRKALEVSE